MTSVVHLSPGSVYFMDSNQEPFILLREYDDNQYGFTAVRYQFLHPCGKVYDYSSGVAHKFMHPVEDMPGSIP